MPDIVYCEHYLVPKDAAMRQGGMSQVFRGFDVRDGRAVAVKVFGIPTPGDVEVKRRQAQEAFNRERYALALEHPNIVRCFGEGTDAVGNPVIILEWMDSSLEDVRYMSEKGTHYDALDGFDTFYKEIGRPLLDALSFAHNRDVIHRDVKPSNILFSNEGVKLADFSISKLKRYVGAGLTLGSFASIPFSPPEVDDGSFSHTRDTWGFAACVVACLSDHRIVEYADLDRALEDANLPEETFPILKRALSRDPSARYQRAQLLKTDLDRIAAKRDTGLNRLTIAVGFALDPMRRQRLAHDLGVAGRVALEEALIDDLRVATLKPLMDMGKAKADMFVASGRRLEQILQVRTPGRTGLVVKNASLMDTDYLERGREGGWAGSLDIPYKPLPTLATRRSLEQLDELYRQVLAKHEQNVEAQLREQERNLFREWDTILKVLYKSESVRAQNTLVAYHAFETTGRTVTFHVDQLLEEDQLDKQWEIDGSRRRGTLVSVEEVSEGQYRMTLAMDSLVPRDLPRRGKLRYSNGLALEAIKRQQAANNTVRFDKAVRGDLGALIVDPSRARRPDAIVLSEFVQELDESKQKAVCAALGAQDLFLVQGPPGTGKTRFITELVLQSLRRRPDGRILITSQTHVALDNVLERLRALSAERSLSLRLVRHGRADDQRVSASVRDLLPAAQMQAWKEEARKRSAVWRDAESARRGVDPNAVLLASLLKRLAACRRAGHSAGAAVAKLEAEVSGPVEPSANAARPDTRRTSKKALDGLKARRDHEKARAEELVLALQAHGRSRAELLESTPDSLDAQAAAAVPPSAATLPDLFALQDLWLAEFGSSPSYWPLLFARADVVAATCVGIASVERVEELDFDLAILDEASKATAMEALIPLSRANRILVVGDQRQLPPFTQDVDPEVLKEFDQAQEDLTPSLFLRLSEALPPECRASLTVQHRMVPAIGDLISTVFYEGLLVSAPKAEDPLLENLFGAPVVWKSTSALPDKAEQPAGGSFENPAEVRAIRTILDTLQEEAAREGLKYSVIVLSAYAAQRSALQRMVYGLLLPSSPLRVICGTVDSFQGREADIAIYSVTRSNPTGRQGFLRDPRRLNVALSRGALSLVIVGDGTFCGMLPRNEGADRLAEVFDYISKPSPGCLMTSLLTGERS